jgi:hypothetical protein
MPGVPTAFFAPRCPVSLTEKPARSEETWGEKGPHGFTSVVHEVHDGLALPDCPVFVPNRRSYGAIWDPGRQDIVVEALTGVHVLPERKDAEIDQAWLLNALETTQVEPKIQDEPSIFGGLLIRHFGHFFHESLSRLWWLGSVDLMSIRMQSVAASLQALQSNVWFFMPPWQNGLDQGKDLLAYMEEILAGLGLEPGRVRIITEPTRFRRILVPFQPWGFALNPSRVNQLYGCDSIKLMRNLLDGYRPRRHYVADSAAEASAAESAIATPYRDTPLRVFVSRSSLPLDLGRLIGDVILDQVLAEAGYLVFHPENHSISEQITLYSAADELVFIDGSSLYLLWISRLRPWATIKVILRRRQGAWMAERIKDLLPGDTSLHWEVIDALIGEEVSSEKDWLSHNLVDFREVLRRILGRTPSALTPHGQQVLQAYAKKLIAETQLELQASVLQALMEALFLPPHRAPNSRRKRLKLKLVSLSHRLRSGFGAFFKRFPTPEEALPPSTNRGLP